MILKNKKLLLLTSLLTLLPIPVGLILRNRFPENMAIHWGFTGQADGFASPDTAIFVLPLVMLLAHWVCVLFTSLDKGNRDRNRKVQSIVLWVIPIITNLSLLGMYALALDVQFSPVAWTMVPMGMLFAIIGNYLPKTRMNSTIGIKIPWTYSSEENWNATHRFGGKVWMMGGIGIILCALIPHMWAVIILFSLIMIMVLLPVGYSYRYYRMQKARGDDVSPKITVNPKTAKASSLILAVILVLCAGLLFTGELNYVFGEESFTIEGSYYSDLTVRYDAIETIEYREGNEPGLRVGGFGSFRLLMGFFENEEFGTYTRYTYYDPDAAIVMRVNGKTVVISAEDASATEHIYRFLLEKTDN